MNHAKDIETLYRKARDIQKIITIRKTLLSCGAYSSTNMEKQNKSFERLKVPEWEKEIIFNSWEVTRKYSHVLLKELDILTKNLSVELDKK